MSQRDNSPFFDCRWDMTRTRQWRKRSDSSALLRQGSWRNASDRKHCVRAVRREPMCWWHAWAEAAGVPVSALSNGERCPWRLTDLSGQLAQGELTSAPISLAVSPSLSPLPPRSLWNVTSYRVPYQHKQAILWLAQKSSCAVLLSSTFCFRCQITSKHAFVYETAKQ